uniref:Bacterial Ig-like domain-containing protein n=1 Tax=Aegilops tauschii subsp. strangulata TaxID=200361 RepID=A0A453EGK9_AEGTS
MVWKSWGRRLLLSAVVLLCSGAAGAAAAGDVSLSLTTAPPRISTSASAVFAFRAVQSSGWTCGDCAITCKLDGERRSDCGGNGNGTEVLIVYGPGRVEPSTLEAVVPGLRYSVAVSPSPDVDYGRMILVMRRGFCTDVAGHRFRRSSNSSFTLRFDKRSDSMNITASIPEKLLQIQGAMRVVEATNDDRELRIYMSFAEPVMNSSAEVLAALTVTGAVLTPTNRSTLGNRRFGYVVNKISSTAVVTVACDTSSVISRQGTPVYSSQPLTFLYDTRRPSVKLATSTVRTSSHTIPVLIKFEKPVFNFTSSAVQLSGGKLLSFAFSFHEASKSIYTMQILAVDKLVSVQVAENTAQDVAGNPNLPSDRLQVRHYSVPASSSSIATIATVIFAATAIVATLLTVSTSSLIASGAMARPSSYSISEPSRNLLRMACHIQIFALSRWLSINLPVEYYELAKGIEWTIPYIRLPWEGPSADPFVGYSTMPAIAYSELVDRSDVVQADPYYPGAAPGGQQQQIMPMQIPVEGKPPATPLQIPALDGKPLTAMEYRSFFENQDMKPEAQIIMKLQDLDGWKYFGRNMLWLGVIGGGLVMLHLLLLLYLRLRYRGGTGKYGALVLPRFEIMLAILAMPCISQASAALIRGTPFISML